MKKLSILTVLVMLVTVTAYSVSGTYAKYTSEFTGTSSATVAKWAFEIGAEGTALAKDFTFNLFDTAKTYEEDGVTVDDDVKAGKIAPGTGGKFDLALYNKSEVTASYKVQLDDSETDAKLSSKILYSLDGTNYISLAALNTELAKTETNADDYMEMESSNVTKTIYWKWAFNVDEATDITDTELGVTPVTATVKATITVSQIN